MHARIPLGQRLFGTPKKLNEGPDNNKGPPTMDNAAFNEKYNVHDGEVEANKIKVLAEVKEFFVNLKNEENKNKTSLLENKPVKIINDKALIESSETQICDSIAEITADVINKVLSTNIIDKPDTREDKYFDTQIDKMAVERLQDQDIEHMPELSIRDARPPFSQNELRNNGKIKKEQLSFQISPIMYIDSKSINQLFTPLYFGHPNRE